MSERATIKESFVDVLIIGAGPTGMMCGNALVQAGVSIRIIDKRYMTNAQFHPEQTTDVSREHQKRRPTRRPS